MRFSVLVLMPFSQEYGDHYELAIKPAVVGAGGVCIRADEELILDDVASGVRRFIADADIMVAEVTEPNPNVYYEIGYAHGLGKDVIFVVRESAELPFDARGIQHIAYATITELRDRLADVLRRWKIQMESVRDGLVAALDVGRLRRESQHVLQYLMACEGNEAPAIACAREARGLYAVLHDLKFLGCVEFHPPLRAGVRVRLTPAARNLLSQQGSPQPTDHTEAGRP